MGYFVLKFGHVLLLEFIFDIEQLVFMAISFIQWKS